MTQAQLDCAVAKATGESLFLIENMGFSTIDNRPRWDDEPILVVECPFCGAASVLASSTEDLPVVAECARCETVFDFSDDEIESVSLDELVIAPTRTFVPAA